MVPQLEEAGLSFVGTDERMQRMEIIELSRDVHPFYYATQYHPEFKSRPTKISPPFYGLILAATGKLNNYIESQDLNPQPEEYYRSVHSVDLTHSKDV